MLWVETNGSGCKTGTGGRPGAGTRSRGPAFTSQQLQRGQMQPKSERLVLLVTAAASAASRRCLSAGLAGLNGDFSAFLWPLGARGWLCFPHACAGGVTGG